MAVMSEQPLRDHHGSVLKDHCGKLLNIIIEKLLRDRRGKLVQSTVESLRDCLKKLLSNDCRELLVDARGM